MRSITLMVGFLLLVISVSPILAFEGSDTENFRIEVDDDARHRWHRNETVSISLDILNPDHDNIEYHCNLEDSDLFNITVSDQLPEYNPVKGIDWDFDDNFHVLTWKLKDESIWISSGSQLGSINVTLVFYAVDEDGYWSEDTIELYLINWGENQGDPVYPERISHDPISGKVGENVSFWVEAVKDPISRNPEYIWDFSDGATGKGQNVTHSFLEPGWKTVQMWIEDGEHITEEKALRIEIIGEPTGRPVAIITSPSPNRTYASSRDILFDASDSFDINGDELSYFWSSNISGHLGEGVSISSTLEPGTHRITLWITDGEYDNTAGTIISVFPPDQIDSDNDGINDLLDAFPNDPAASIDSDGDGYPDQWNPGKTSEDSTSGLEIDRYPFDAEKHFPENGKFPWNTILIIFISLVIIITLLTLGLYGSIVVKRRKTINSRFPKEVRRYGKLATGEIKRKELSREERRKLLSEAKKKNKISNRTFKEIEIEIDDSLDADGESDGWDTNIGKL